MAITNIKLKNAPLHLEAEISLMKGRIASIVGLNGQGKSQLLYGIDKNRQTHNFYNNESTTIDFEFDLSDDIKKRLNSAPIFNDDYFREHFIFKDVFDKNSWPNTLRGFERKLSEHFCSISKHNIEKMPKSFLPSHNDFETKVNNSLEGGNLIAEFKNIIASSHIGSYFASNDVLNKSIDIFITVSNEIKNIIKTRLITTSQDGMQGYIYFKEDQSIDIQRTSSNKQIIRFFAAMGIRLKYHTGDDFSNFAKEVKEKSSEYFGNLIGKDNANIFIEISPYSNLIYLFNISVEQDGSVLDYNLLSKGTKAFINILMQIGKYNDEYTILLIDEPEEGLHPMLQIELRNNLEDISSKSKCVFIVATHSIYMLNGTSNRVNTYVSHSEGVNKKLYNITEFHRAKKDYKGVQIWDMMGFNSVDKYTTLVKGDKVIFVEGESDKIIINKIFSIINPKEIDEYKIVSMNGWTNAIRWETNAKNSGVKAKDMFYLFDGDVDQTKQWFSHIKKTYNHTLINFNTIEDIFEGKEKDWFTQLVDGKYQYKLHHSLKFSNSTKSFSSPTLDNMRSIVKTVEDLIK